MYAQLHILFTEYKRNYIITCTEVATATNRSRIHPISQSRPICTKECPTLVEGKLGGTTKNISSPPEYVREFSRIYSGVLFINNMRRVDLRKHTT